MSLQDEINLYGILKDDVQIIRDKEGVIVARVRFGEGSAILKYFEKEEFRREIHNYEILQGCGIPTIRVLGKSGRSLLLEDIHESPTYRLGEEADFERVDVMGALARWYKKLHGAGAAYVSQHGNGMYMEWDSFTLDNIIAIKDRFNLADSAGIKAITANYDALRRRLDQAPLTLCYNDFYYTNLVVKKDQTEALMFDYNLLGKGCAVSDIKNVTYWFSEENKAAFLSEYGEVDRELMVLDEIAAPIVSLHSAMSRNIFPHWAREAVEDLERVPTLIERL